MDQYICESRLNLQLKMKLVVFLLICTSTLAHGYDAYVKINEGELMGTTYTLPNGRTLLAFFGIPYAAPPTGSNRFAEPKPPKSWQGVKNATLPGNVCIQAAFFGNSRQIEAIGDENCLFLNVFTPKLANYSNESEELMNVLVFIHGGGFMYGTGNDAHPEYILQDSDIVYVSLNYRLGPLGFFSTGHRLASGNYGLKDQAEALRWVQRNIGYFGGNPAKVTIYGSSAGAASVHYHMISPSTKGLFQSAISSSGSVSLPWSLQSSVVNTSKELASSLNCEFKNVSHMMKCLRNKSINEIIAEGYGKYAEEGSLVDFPYSPVIEPQHHTAFLSENPYILMKMGKIKHIPWMMSVVENEGAFFGLVTGAIHNKTKANLMNSYWNYIIPRILKYDNLYSEDERDYISASVRKYYFKNRPLSNQTSKNFFQLLGDRHFYNGIIQTTKMYSSASLEDTYCYKFYYQGVESYVDAILKDGKNYGTLHGEDLFYTLKSYNGKSKTKNDMNMAKLLSSTIVAFMKTGNPNIPELAEKWKPISENGVMNCLGIYTNTIQKMEDIENKKTTRFWNNFFPPENY